MREELFLKKESHLFVRSALWTISKLTNFPTPALYPPASSKSEIGVQQRG